ncbi:hypothetical protein OH76DRAFT_1541666 [Lentinus brumalis]|uniref:MFS general substrate transporter n=1 Tax=Lentinus brumalis TaxID=2498619 RepID=A0A371CUS3_9APHY|nr:hypothetical protein OH76DRAFT_1541666 [Polyporus brumalis]
MTTEDTYQAIDAVVSSNFSIYSPSVSRAREANHGSASESPTRAGQLREVSEHDALLGGGKAAKKPFYRPRPLWYVSYFSVCETLVPFAVVASIVRGMTLAPRVQVYTQLSCNAIYGHDVYDHTRLNETSLFPNSSHIPSFSPSAASVLLELHFPSSDGRRSRSDDDEPDPRRPPSERCLKDPAVQSGAARLQTIMTTTMGVLSALTTGWWGHFGETHGRTRVLAVSTFGLFMTDLVFILVSTPHSVFAAHGHKLLIISPIIEGLCGGWATLQAATSAYISDCTSDGSRAHIFSRFTGMFFLGFAVGPTIGAFLIKHPFIPIFSPAIGVHNGAPTVTSVFYVGASASFINLMLAIFLFPESVHKKRAKMAAAQPLGPAISSPAAEAESVQQGIVSRFISPLALFLPKSVHGPNGSKHTDWSMTLLAMVLFGYLLSTGIFQIKYLYAEHVYGWGAEQLSYYISTMGFARALYLLFLLPFIISTFKPKSKPAQPAVPVVNADKANAAALANEMRFDIGLIRGSLLIDLFSHSIVALTSPEAGPASGQALFVGATGLNSFGAGLIPAVNSLALCIMQSRGVTDTGKMFGAFSVLQATGQMIVGPVIFGLIYSGTVATFPKTIFAFAASMIFVALAILFLLRPEAMLKSRRKGKRVGAEPGALEAHLDIPARGRSRKSKDIRQSLSGSSFNGMQIPSSGQSYGATSSGSVFGSTSTS